MNKTGWTVFSAVVIALFGGLVVWTQNNRVSIDVSGVDASSIVAASEMSGNIGDHVRGSDDSKVILVEYGDYQCPSCKAAAPNVDSLLAEYEEGLAFVYRQFPLTEMHPNARAAAGAAEAAGLQGKFWEMHDRIFEGQGDWGSLDSSRRTNMFAAYAREIGLDEEQFRDDFAGDDINKKISFDRALGAKQGVSATPAFFLNGKPLATDVSNSLVNGDIGPVKEVIDKLLAE